MAQLGYGLGGQLHLLRYLGWHRDLLESRLGERLRAKSIRWLDFGFGGGPEEADRELAGLEFLPAHAAARRSWQSIWPTGMHPVTWDAIGGVASARGTEWILVEAKAHLGELQSNCESKNWRDGLSLIADAMARTQNALGVPMEADWLRGYYRYASRLAALNFLLAAGEKAQLLTICFCRWPGRRPAQMPEDAARMGIGPGGARQASAAAAPPPPLGSSPQAVPGRPPAIHAISPRRATLQRRGRAGT